MSSFDQEEKHLDQREEKGFSPRGDPARNINHNVNAK